MRVYNLTVEYQSSPKGLAIRKPRLSWKIESDKQTTLQESYSIEVREKEKLMWSTGEINSWQSVLIPFYGLP